MNQYTGRNTKKLVGDTKAFRKLNGVSRSYVQRFKNEIASGRFQLELVVKCACCGSNELQGVSSIDRFELPFGSVICEQCGLVSTSPRMKEKDLAYYYSNFYHPLNYGKENLAEQDHLFAAGQGADIFDKVSPYLKQGNVRVLEVGCGLGDVLTGFVQADKTRAYSTVVGTEYSQECLNVAKIRAQNSSLDIKFVEGGCKEAKLVSSKYDLIILSHVFEHMVNLSAEISNMSDLLEDGGLLYVEVPGLYVNHMIDYYGYSYTGYSVHAHMYNFCAQTLLNVFQGTEFSCLEINEKVEAVYKKSAGRTIEKLENTYNESLFYLNLIGDPEFASFNISKDDVIKKNNFEILKLEENERTTKELLRISKTEVDSVTHENSRLSSSLNSIQELLTDVRRFSIYKAPYKKYTAYKALMRLYSNLGQ